MLSVWAYFFLFLVICGSVQSLGLIGFEWLGLGLSLSGLTIDGK